MTTMSTKKMVNDPDHIVDDCLAGLVASNPDLLAVENHRVVIRRDVCSVKNKVGLISGGGSGHEPAFGGYVGKGCLSAAIAGSVFASPPPTSIVAAIMSVAASEPSGILVIVYNYTGDRVNFGLAVERARALVKMRIEICVNADDTALTSADKTAGRRGLSGGKLMLKIAGAMAEQGKSLDEILDVLNHKVINNMGTIGLSLSPCIVPGRTESSFKLAPDEMELGLGVHGEAGIKRIKLMSAKDSVKIMLAHMTNAKSSTRLTLKQGDYVAVMINNLGSVSNLEMGLLTNEVMAQLQENYKVAVRRIYVGQFFTSIEMAGFLVTVLRLTSPEVTGYLDAETTVQGWSGQAHVRKIDGPNAKLPDPLAGLKGSEKEGPESSEFGREALIKAVSFACEALVSCEGQLNTMDSGAGDSDCGSTLKRGAETVLVKLKDKPELAIHPSQLFHVISQVAEKEMGGSSGGMYSIFFEAAAVVIESSSNGLTATIFCDAVKAGLAAIMKYGRAQPGDRTMVDALSTFTNQLESHLAKNPNATMAALEAATNAAEKGAKDTLKMKASAGRASYVSAAELRHPDPGAHAVGIIVRAVYEGIKIKASEMGRQNL